MKSDLPHVGLSAPELRTLLRPILAEHRFIDRGSWEAAVLELWDDVTHREEWYAAVALLRHRTYRDWLDPDLLPLLEHLVRTGAWWDVVDEIASHLVGQVLLDHRAAVTPVMDAWSVDADSMWVRRTAMLAQLRHAEDTDTDLLERVLVANLDDTAYGGSSSSARRSGGRCASTRGPTRHGCGPSSTRTPTGSAACPAERRSSTSRDVMAGGRRSNHPP